jgi:hypothetical protein
LEQAFLEELFAAHDAQDEQFPGDFVVAIKTRRTKLAAASGLSRAK